MHGDAMGGSHRADPFNGRQRINRSTAAVVGVLQTDQRGLNSVWFFGTDCRLNLFGRDEAPIAHDPMELDTCQRSCGALFISDDMRRALDDHFLAWLRMEANGELIAHRTGRDE